MWVGLLIVNCDDLRMKKAMLSRVVQEKNEIRLFQRSASQLMRTQIKVCLRVFL